MEDRQTYTYKKKNKSNVNAAKLFLVVFAVLVLGVAAVIGVRMGTKKADTESSVAASKEALSKAEEQATVSTSKYSPGSYKVQTGGYTLLLRERPSKNAPDRNEIPDNSVIRISEITESPDAPDENYRYWGKTVYDGETGWVPMGYLKETDEEPAAEEVPEQQEEENPDVEEVSATD